MQPDLQTSLGTRVSALSLGIVGLDQALLDVSGWSQENEVLYAIEEIVQLGPYPAGRMAEREIDPVASLPFQIRIADLESGVPRVRAVVV